MTTRPEIERRCKTCSVIKPIESFTPGARYRNGRMPVCRDCRADYLERLHQRPRQTVGSKKACRKCAQEKDLGEFTKDRRSPDGYAPRCRSCRKEDRVGKEDPRRSRDRMLRWKFGISVDQYDEMLELQDGRCASCGDEPDGKPLHVDHCHETLRVRKLLCSNCNTALGLLKEDPKRIEALLEYAIQSMNEKKEVENE